LAIELPDAEFALAGGGTPATCTARSAGFVCLANQVAGTNRIEVDILTLSGTGLIAAGDGDVAVLHLTDAGTACSAGLIEGLPLSQV